jgi:hypothetical protein
MAGLLAAAPASAASLSRPAALLRVEGAKS